MGIIRFSAVVDPVRDTYSSDSGMQGVMARELLGLQVS